ncbi:MDR family MFS transporter [Abyssibius alkaniclasticus]|uniref:MDR family MFS transporter n=1 Tax=Abyssibius alkaniclasticus TaxID=2881234 RepID=UPI0040598730
MSNFTQTPTAATPAAAPEKKGLVLGAVGALLLLAALDQTIVSTALPTIVAELGGLNHLSWVVTAYLLTSTVTAPLYGKLGDLYGRKLMMQISVIIFLLGSALCALAESMTFLIAARGLQGVGGGGLFVLALTVVGDVVPARERGKVQGIFGGVFGISSVAGPLMGGFFVDALSWHWIFLINLPIGIVALVIFAVAFKARGTRTRHEIDYSGAVLLTGALSALVLFTSLGGRSFAWDSLIIIGLILFSIIATLGFIRVESRASEPILPLGLFRHRTFAVFVILGFIVGVAMLGAITFLPLYLQVAKGVSPTASGLQMIPMTFGILLGSITSGQIMSRTGHYKMLPIVGAVFMFAGMLLLARLDANSTAAMVGLSMAVLGIGLGPMMSVSTTATQNALPREMMGVATAGLTLFRQVGGSIGVALFGAVFSIRLAVGMGNALPAGVSADSLRGDMVASLPDPVRVVVLEAFTNALAPIFLLGAAVSVVGFIVAFSIREVPLRSRTDPPPMAE